MSGLEKFNRRESALCRLKDFLLRERSAARESLNSTASSNESIALDLDQSFQKIIQNHMEKQRKPIEEKENLYKTACENTLDCKSGTQSTLSNATMYSCDDTITLQDCLSDSDDSFLELEKMCEKTFSDPDNTIHQYLTNRKAAKHSSAPRNTTSDSACITRLLEEIDNQLKENRRTMNDQIELNDIEAPSCLWENTIGVDMSNMMMTPERPVKIQPKTPAILDETLVGGTPAKTASMINTCNRLDNLMKLKSADQRHIKADEKLSETCLTATDDINVEMEELSLQNGDDSVQLISWDDKDDNCNVKAKELQKLSDTFYVTPMKSKFDEKMCIPSDLIKFDETLPVKITKEEHSSPMAHVTSPSTAEAAKNDNTIILLSDDEDNSHDYNESHNTAFSLDLENSRRFDFSGMQEPESHGDFNNTLEEIDYIMKQGIKYLADTRQLPNCLESKELLSPSPMSSPQTPVTVIKKPKTIMSEEFKKPRAFTRIPQCKSLLATKKPTTFQHIVSPVGAYIKNTPKIPMTSDFKTTSNVIHSKAVRGLNYNTSKITTKKNEGFSGLPKKAYISSENVHVVDQRKPTTIPGGEKIHKFLHTSKTPAVIRHEGKIKSNIASQPRPTTSNASDSSWANLSTISGDISLRILKDAKR